MNKIIFLDIDGVLNSGYYCQRNHCPRWLEKRKLALIKELIDKTEAKIVLISYRCQFDFQKELIVGELLQFGLVVSGIIPDVNDKNAGVKAYLNQLEEVTKFVIIDDGDYGFQNAFPGHWIRPSQWWGVMDHHIEKAIKLLS